MPLGLSFLRFLLVLLGGSRGGRLSCPLACLSLDFCSCSLEVFEAGGSACSLPFPLPCSGIRELFAVISTYARETIISMSVDKDKLRSEQANEYGSCIEYLTDDEAPIPGKETLASMSYYSVEVGILFKSYLSGHLRKRGTYRDTK